MWQEKGKGRGLLAGGKTQPASTLKWEVERRALSPQEWWKTLGGLPGSGRGSRVAKGHGHPRSGIIAPGERNLWGDRSGATELRGRTDAGEERTETTHQP